MSEIAGFNPETTPAPQAELRFAFEIGPGSQRLLLPLGLHGEIWPQPRFAPLPGTAAWLRGLVNLRGTLAPAYEIAGSLGLPSPPPNEERLLVLGEGENRVGLVIHGDPRAVTVTPSRHSEPAPAALSPFTATSWLTESGERAWELDLGAWVRHARHTSTLGGDEDLSAALNPLERGSE